VARLHEAAQIAQKTDTTAAARLRERQHEWLETLRRLTADDVPQPKTENAKANTTPKPKTDTTP
jgi:hypothetical protein